MMSTSNILQEINEVFEQLDDAIFETMYIDETDLSGISFCELAKITKKHNLLLVIKDTVWGYLSDARTTKMIDISISLAEPCCLGHALDLLTNKFQDKCEELYGEIPECRNYYLEGCGFNIESISKDSINTFIDAGT